MSDNNATLVNEIRNHILSISSVISEQVKWNSPNFFYNGEMKLFDPKEYKRDIVVLNVRPERILMVFPTGAIINNSKGILEGEYPDGRRMITIQNKTDFKDKSKSIEEAISDWLNKVEK